MKPRLLLAALSLALFAGNARAVTIDWNLVGNPGNVADAATGSFFGAVGYAYRIATKDVTNSQYAEFLNSKDQTGANTLGLWNSNMSSAPYGGIDFNSGNANGSKYTLISGAQNHPVNFVTWYDTIRFANWLNNGQGNGDTESGAYTLLDGTPIPFSVSTRNAGATVFLPSENEWYKAAYYNPATHTYFQYPTSSDSTPIVSGPTGLANHANYNLFVGNLTNVGAYTGTTSPYGAFDMGGDVFQWNEALIGSTFRGLRGGSFVFDSNDLLSSTRIIGDLPTLQAVDGGFRVASIVPEPSSLALAAMGLAGFAAWGWRRA